MACVGVHRNIIVFSDGERANGLRMIVYFGVAVNRGTASPPQSVRLCTVILNAALKKKLEGIVKRTQNETYYT